MLVGWEAVAAANKTDPTVGYPGLLNDSTALGNDGFLLWGGDSAAGAFIVKVTVADPAAYKPEGATVVQVYAAPLSASRTGQVRYKKTLVGFTKANVAADGETEVEVEVRAEELGYTVFKPMESGADNHPRVVEPGQYRLLACRSECDCQLNTTVTVF